MWKDNDSLAVGSFPHNGLDRMGKSPRRQAKTIKACKVFREMSKRSSSQLQMSILCLSSQPIMAQPTSCYEEQEKHTQVRVADLQNKKQDDGLSFLNSSHREKRGIVSAASVCHIAVILIHHEVHEIIYPSSRGLLLVSPQVWTAKLANPIMCFFFFSDKKRNLYSPNYLQF